MRIPAIALAAAATAAASLLFMTPAHAATTKAAAPADLPTYTCVLNGPRPPIYPALVNGIDCQASNGAPTQGPVQGPVKFTFLTEEPNWICEYADASNYPERVLGQRCYLEGRPALW